VSPRPEVVSSGQTVAVSPYTPLNSNRKSSIASSSMQFPPYLYFRFGRKWLLAIFAYYVAWSAADGRRVLRYVGGRPDVEPEVAISRHKVVTIRRQTSPAAVGGTGSHTASSVQRLRSRRVLRSFRSLDSVLVFLPVYITYTRIHRVRISVVGHSGKISKCLKSP